MATLVPQIVVDEAEAPLAARALPGRRGDRVRRSRARQPRGGARPPARRRADLVGARARRLARHVARARARAARPRRRLHGLGRAEPRARVARRDDADERRRRARAAAAAVRRAVPRAPGARALRRARRAPHRRADRAARPARRLRARRGVRRAVRDRPRGRRARAPLDDVARVQEFYEAFAGAMVYDGDPRAAAPRRPRARGAERDPARRGAALAHPAPTTRSRAPSPTIPPAGSRTTRSSRSCASSSSARSRPSSRRSRTPCCCCCATPTSSRRCAPSRSSPATRSRRACA